MFRLFHWNRKTVLGLGLLLVFPLLLGVSCGPRKDYVTEPEPINPPTTVPPDTRTPKPPGRRVPPTPPSNSLVVSWREIAKVTPENWKTREQGPGSPLFCRVGEEKKVLWCFDRYSQSFAEIFRSDSEIVSFASSASGKRLAVLLRDKYNDLALRGADSPFLAFRVLRTFPKETTRPSLKHVSFLLEELIVHGKGAMFSEKNKFLTLSDGAQNVPALSQISFLNAGYYVALDKETGDVVQNSPSSITKWSPMTPPQQNLKARASHLATNGSALALLYNDGSLYWRCSEKEGFRLKRYETKLSGLFWFQGRYGLHLAVRTQKSLQFVSLDSSAELSLPNGTNLLEDTGDLGPERIFLSTKGRWYEGVVKPT